MFRRLAIIGLVSVNSTWVFADVWTAPARDDGQRIGCILARDQSQFDAAMGQAGWSKNGRSVPVVDFRTSMAVVIAPRTFRANSDIGFIEYKDEAPDAKLKWTFVARKSGEIVQENMADFSSQAPPGPEILVFTTGLRVDVKRILCTGPYNG